MGKELFKTLPKVRVNLTMTCEWGMPTYDPLERQYRKAIQDEIALIARDEGIKMQKGVQAMVELLNKGG